MALPFRLALVAVLAAAAGCGGSGPGQQGASSSFAYDRSQPLEAEVGARVNENYPIAVYEVSYRAGDNAVDAYLVAPEKRASGRLPAVVYVHGAGGDRTQLLVPATWLAARGAIALVITAPSSTLPSPTNASDPLERLEGVKKLEVADGLAVRRAIDLLQARDDVDAARIALVGWSAGARAGALAAATDRRLVGVVLMSLGSASVQEFVDAAPAELGDEVRGLFASIDPLAAVRRLDPEGLLLQQAENDEVVPEAALRAIAEAAPDGADVRWYPTPHSLDASAYDDHLAWLSARLAIAGPAVPGAGIGPGGTGAGIPGS